MASFTRTEGEKKFSNTKEGRKERLIKKEQRTKTKKKKGRW
jgi:hypothetical protein